jgi:type IV pilus assembly protein PilC
VRRGVLEGLSVSDAMRRHPKVFNQKFIALVRAGETGGVLEQTLEVAADQFDREAELQEKIRSAMVYPAIVVMSAIGVVVFMLLVIVPVFQDVYKGFGAKLPAPTLMLISLSDILVHKWWMVAIGVGIAVYLFRKAVATKKGSRIYARILLKVPLLGPLNRKVAISRFTETLAGGVRAGIPILQALAVAAQTCGNVIINDVIEKVSVVVQEGAALSKPLEQSKEFPPLVTYMIAAGEQSGNLDIMLAEITRFYSRDIEYAVGRLTRAMEPLMTIVIGIVVLDILLALYLPVFSMTQVLHK